jgi:hypothetical protein
VVLKEPLLILERQRDTLGLVDIPLSSVDDRDVPQPQRDNSTTLVKTPIVLVPSGSTSRAIFRPSELAKSVFAPVTARMMALGLEMNRMSMSRICFSISRGWSPTGTLVRPGRSTRVRVRTLGEKIRRLMGLGEMPN